MPRENKLRASSTILLIHTFAHPPVHAVHTDHLYMLMLNTLGEYHVFLKCPFLLNPMPVNPASPVPLILLFICWTILSETFTFPAMKPSINREEATVNLPAQGHIQLSGAFGYILI
jgi:hypothetical protein